MCSHFDTDEIARLGKRFKKLDLDNSGSLSVDEFMRSVHTTQHYKTMKKYQKLSTYFITCALNVLTLDQPHTIFQISGKFEFIVMKRPSKRSPFDLRFLTRVFYSKYFRKSIKSLFSLLYFFLLDFMKQKKVCFGFDDLIKLTRVASKPVSAARH